MRRGAPVIVLGVLLALLLGSYVAYSQLVVSQLRAEARNVGQMTGQVYRALVDTAQDPIATMLDLAAHVDSLGVPVIVTDMSGRPTAYGKSNLPFDVTGIDDPQLAAYVKELDAINKPVREGQGGLVHYGDTRLVRRLRVIPVLQTMLLLMVLGAGVAVLRTRSRADRESVWAGMARESAHQLATPLSSLSGWIELLGESQDDPLTVQAIGHMVADLERLERVAHRFERIGRPPRRDPMDVGQIALRVATYFQARVPTLAHTVTIAARVVGGPLIVEGDAVLLEWALESLAKNALDALAGRGGRIYILATRRDDKVTVRIADDGPGIPKELRDRVFEAGFSTKSSGWGIGLALSKRIVEENHDGKLLLQPRGGGATFDVILRT
ncbi:MAG: HAMP domain-containing sensor histidine kinase [Gemmatimonadaceae bacterium]